MHEPPSAHQRSSPHQSAAGSGYPDEQRSRLGSALWNYLGGSGNAVLITIQSLILIPIYLDRVGPELYGAWLGSGEILGWLLVIDLGLPNLLAQRIAAAHSEGDRSRADAWLFAGATLLGLVAVITGISGVVLADGLPLVMGLQGEGARQLVAAFRLGCVATAVTIFGNLFTAHARGVQRTMFVNVVMVFAAAGNFATALLLVLNGYGLMAIAYGMLTRSLITLAGGVIFLITERPLPRPVDTPLLRQATREALRIAPITTLGSISFAVSSRCELFVIAALGAPEMAAAYMVVRKGADVGRTFMSILSFSCYAPFAHLVATREWARVRQVYTALRSLQSTIAVALLGAYILLNESFVHAWVGREHQVDLLLTVLIALQTYAYAEALMTNHLYRAGGFVAEGAKSMTVEAACRVALLTLALDATGTLAVVPAVGIITAAGLALFCARRIVELFEQSSSETIPPTPLSLTVARLALAATAIALATLTDDPRWPFILAVGAAWVSLAGLVQLGLDRNALLGASAPLRLIFQRGR